MRYLSLLSSDPLSHGEHIGPRESREGAHGQTTPTMTRRQRIHTETFQRYDHMVMILLFPVPLRNHRVPIRTPPHRPEATSPLSISLIPPGYCSMGDGLIASRVMKRNSFHLVVAKPSRRLSIRDFRRIPFDTHWTMLLFDYSMQRLG